MTDSRKALMALLLVVAGCVLAGVGQWAGGVLIMLWAAWITSGLEQRQ